MPLSFANWKTSPSLHQIPFSYQLQTDQVLGNRYLPPTITQSPQCDGVHVDRALFNKNVVGGDPSFISGQVDDSGNIVLNAGDAQSIWKGAEVEIYASNFASTKTNKRLGKILVSKTTVSKSILQKETSFQPPAHFYAKLTQPHPEEKISIYCADMQKLEVLLKTPIHHLAGSRIICVGKEGNPDIVLSFEGDTVIFERKDKLLSAPIRNCIPVTVLSVDGPMHVLQSAARFVYYLNKRNPSKHCIKSDMIPMDFHQLNEELDVSFDTIFIPGPNLNKEGLATVIIKGNGVGCVIDGDEDFGLTIYNETKLHLHPYLFAFDSDLSISEHCRV
jgi:hypothetical protein